MPPTKGFCPMGTLPLAGLSRLLHLGWEVVIEGEPTAAGAPTTVDSLQGLTSATSRAISFPVFQSRRREDISRAEVTLLPTFKILEQLIQELVSQ